MPFYGASIRIKSDTATPAVARVRAMLASTELGEVLARGAQNVVSEHLVKYDQDHPNRYAGAGAQRTHTFLAAARNTHGSLTAKGIRVTIVSPAISLHYHGGDVLPVTARLLAIPIDPTHPAADPEAAQAYGSAPRKFSHLRLVMYGKTGVGALVGRARTNIKIGADRRKGREGQQRIKQGATIEGGGIFYWLVKSATISPHPDVLPTTDRLLAGIEQSGLDYLAAKGVLSNI